MKMTMNELEAMLREDKKETKQMELLPDKLKEKFKAYPLYSQDGKKEKAKVVCKFFNPFGSGSWYCLEGEPLGEDDFEFFGYISLLEREYGYFTLKELEGIQKSNSGATIERDLFLNEDITLEEVLKEDGLFEEYSETFLRDDEEPKKEENE